MLACYHDRHPSDSTRGPHRFLRAVELRSCCIIDRSPQKYAGHHHGDMRRSRHNGYLRPPLPQTGPTVSRQP